VKPVKLLPDFPASPNECTEFKFTLKCYLLNPIYPMWFHSPREGSRSHCFSLPHSAVHLVVVATQHHANNVLTDVVHVTLHGGLQSDTALSNSGCNTSEGWTFASSISTCETLFVLPIYIWNHKLYVYIMYIIFYHTSYLDIICVHIIYIFIWMQLDPHW